MSIQVFRNKTITMSAQTNTSSSVRRWTVILRLLSIKYLPVCVCLCLLRVYDHTLSRKAKVNEQCELVAVREQRGGGEAAEEEGGG